MPEIDHLEGSYGVVGKGFQTTAWSDIQRSTQKEDSALALRAWEHLCKAYWVPIYTHICRWGNSPDAAKDLTQDFFYHLLRRERLKKVDRSRGKFRSFLLTTLNHFLHSEWDRRIAQMRDERVVVSIDQIEADGGSLVGPTDGTPPDVLFERQWAASVFRHVRERLVDELQTRGKEAKLSLLPVALYEIESADSVSYRTLAEKLQVSEDSVKQMVKRLRQRWGEILREEVSNTVEHPSEVEEEILHFQRIVGAHGLVD
jgi:RNA polymerase sigma factor (sigma-70 family)